MSDPCEFKEEIMNMGKNIAGLTEIIKVAIRDTKDHIEAGSKWRLAIFCSCIGLVGLFITGAITFGVNHYRLGKVEEDVKEVRIQLYDLNYSKGKEIGLSESKR